ncbi:MAG: TrbC/VirB2 family protein [Burkholderiales bacterium]|nr:TrbC/VirB2 family protein [Burkholderiales bacterium]
MTRPSRTLLQRLSALAPTLALALAAAPAHAQLEKVNTTLTLIQTTLIGVSVVCLTIAIIWAGYKMIFQHARWTDISNIVIGGILIGASGPIAAWLAAA